MTVLMKKVKIPAIIWTVITLTVFTVSGQPGGLKERLKEHVYVLADDSMAGRKAGTGYAAQAAEYIAGEFEKTGLQPYFTDTYYQYFHPDMLIGKSKSEFRNVVAMIPGSDPKLKNEYIVVGAHYDHIGLGQNISGGDIYNGADDNASGVAALIELARELYSGKESLKRSIIIAAFDAEETGLVGSRYFVRNIGIPLDKVKLMISLDMVGWYQASRKLHYYGVATLKEGKNTIKSPAAEAVGLNVAAEKFESNVFSATDTEPFAVRGIPTLHITTGTKSPYHKPEDRPELIDYDGLEKVTEHAAIVMKSFASAPRLTATGKKAFSHRNYSKGFEFGIVAIGGSNFFNYTSGNERGKTAPSYGGGLYTQLNLNYFGIRPEIRYERMGAKNGDGKLWMNSVVVPFSLVIQTPKSLVGGTYISGGAYYRHIFSGYHNGGPGIDFSNHYYRNEVGAQWNVGVWLYRIGISFEKRYGFTKLLKDSGQGPNYKNRTTHFVLYYTF